MTDGGAGRVTRQRPFRPVLREAVRWPEHFGQRFTVFVDVEEEFDWRTPLSAAQRATKAMRAFPDAHRRFAQAGVGLTCMVTHPIATDPAAVAMLRHGLQDGRSAIGAQLHTWVTPPFEERVGPLTSYQGNLVLDLEAAKIGALTEAIGEAFGVRPIAFRAGRYGLGPATLGLLAQAGYRLDSSVRAGYDYRMDGGPDFSRAGNAAYREDDMIELPLTTVYIGGARRSGAGRYRALGRIPYARALAARSGLLQRIALTPEDMPIAAALRAVEVAAGEGNRLLVFSFHSPSLAPGHTPYVRDAADLAMFWGWWDAVLRRLERLGIRYASLAEIIAAADENGRGDRI